MNLTPTQSPTFTPGAILYAMRTNGRTSAGFYMLAGLTSTHATLFKMISTPDTILNSVRIPTSISPGQVLSPIVGSSGRIVTYNGHPIHILLPGLILILWNGQSKVY